MHKTRGFSKMWFLLALLVSFMAGCGEHDTPVVQNSGNNVTAFSVAGGTAAGVDNSAKTIAVTVPNGTNVTALVATFATSPGASVMVGSTPQVSGVTPNNFSGPVLYTVTAADGSVSTYTVTVIATTASAKAITSYALAGVSGTINESAKTITVTLPNGSLKTGLVASFTTTGSGVKVGSVPQVSGSTSNDFSAPVAYTVSSVDTSAVIYTVTVNVAQAFDKTITTFTLAGATGTVNEAAKTIAVSVTSGTPLTAAQAVFTTTGSSVKVGTTTQTSGTTANNFSNPVLYTVTAADGSSVIYTVTVTVLAAKGPAPVLLGAAGNYVILAKSAVSNVPTSAIVGDIGLSPAAESFLTGFSETLAGPFATAPQVTGKLFAADMAVPTSSNLTTAISDMALAYTDAAGRSLNPIVNLGSGEIGGLTLLPGLYKWTSGVKVSSDLTLTGGPNDVWILQIPGTLTVSSAKQVTLTGGALAKNVFWQVAGGATIGTTAHFEGIILSQTAITLDTGATMTGRALAQTAVVLKANAVTQPTN